MIKDKRLQEALLRNDITKFAPPILVSTEGTERSFRENISECICARYEAGNHYIIVKDNRMKEEPTILQIGNVTHRASRENPNDGRVYSPEGLAPSLNTMGGGNRQPMIISYSRDSKGNIVKRNLKEISNTLKASPFDTTEQYLAVPSILSLGYRIRKLTPRECFRLMDVDDNHIDTIQAAGISNSQMYKLAGNSIVVSNLFHIFRKMFIDTDSTPQPGQQLSLF